MPGATRIYDRFDGWDTEDMLKLGRLMGRRKSFDDTGNVVAKNDEPIIHQTVPEEVLNPNRQDAPPEDRSWMDAVPIAERAEPNVPEPKPTHQERPVAERQKPEPDKTEARRADMPELSFQVANGEASARPRFPFGWLVVVEGPGVGEWFLLERGVSHIGSAEGQTVRLDFGDATVSPIRHAAVAYDEGRNAFVLDNSSDQAVRLNGTVARSQATLRDGDVISVGGTSLRLVALCSPNFHWDSETSAG